MKILLVSDSHGDYASLDRLAASYPDMDLYLHAGDSEQDEWSIKPFISVTEYLIIPSPYGNIFVQHTPYVSKELLNKHNAKIVIHGHTHIRRNEMKHDILYVNPGALNYARDKFDGSYAILDIESNSVDIKFYTLI